MAKNKKIDIIEEVEIVDIGVDGQAIGKAEEMVVLVNHGVPGDVMSVELRKKRRNYVEGVCKKMIKFSEERCEPKCAHFDDCGGCKWQDMKYERQLFYKEKAVYDALRKIAKVEIQKANPILPSERIYDYRNKLEFTFSPKRYLTAQEIASPDEIPQTPALGFHIPNRFDKILDIEKCHLQGELSNRIRNAVKAFAIENAIPFYDLRTHEGVLRTLVIRISSSGEVMVILNFGKDVTEEIVAKVGDFLMQKFPEITSLMYVVNDKLNDSFSDLPVRLYRGKDFIVEKMGELMFKVGPKSFYQTNSAQAYRLYSVVKRMAHLTGKEVVYDLYTGTGTIANFVAREAKKVVGIEYVPEAIDDAQHNSTMNKILNTLFFAGDMKDVLNLDFIQEHGRPDLVILDPPRAGLHPSVIETLLRVAPPRMIYVSCNPASQARDIAAISEYYKVVEAQPVDMFPNTHHVENVLLLHRK